MLVTSTSAECFAAHHVVLAGLKEKSCHKGHQALPASGGWLGCKSEAETSTPLACSLHRPRTVTRSSRNRGCSIAQIWSIDALIATGSTSSRLFVPGRKSDRCGPLQIETRGPPAQRSFFPLASPMASAVANEAAPGAESQAAPAGTADVAVLINGGSGKMGQAVAEAALKAGLRLVPVALAGPAVPQHQVDLNGFHLDVYGGEHRDEVLDRALAEHPSLIIVDYTLPAAVNDNAEWYCSRGVPFVMGTTGGDRQKLMDTVRGSGNYAVIAAQMGKQVVAFIAAMEALAEACPGAFAGYSLQVTESHQSSKVDTSGTAKEVVAAFQRLGVRFSVDQIEMVRDPAEQVARMKVPEEYLRGHAFHTYRLVAPDGTVSFEFQHNVCGRSIYAEGTVDAVLFLANKIAEKSEKKLYNMIDVLRGGAMR